MKVSVIIPAYNEEGTITRTLNIYKAFMSENFEDFEADSANFFNLVANVFKTGKPYKVSICYEW